MTRDDIIRMAREADREWDTDYTGRIMVEFLEEFAALVAAAERKACEAIAEQQLHNTAILTSLPPQSAAAWNIRNVIRARGES